MNTKLFTVATCNLNQWAMDEHVQSAGASATLAGGSGVTFRIVTTTSADWAASAPSESHLKKLRGQLGGLGAF